MRYKRGPLYAELLSQIFAALQGLFCFFKPLLALLVSSSNNKFSLKVQMKQKAKCYLLLPKSEEEEGDFLK